MTSEPNPARRLPPWLKRPMPGQADFTRTRAIVDESRVATVCVEARCPNITECWAKRHATFMILGDRCTRRCHFCAVETARPHAPEPDEPQRLATAVARLNLNHVVITAVARDDLADEGAGHFAECVTEIRGHCPATTIEVLPADFHARPECVGALCDARPEIYNHNIETVERLSPAIRPQAKYRRSLDVLETVKRLTGHIVTKSGVMVGLGETRDELHRTFADLRGVGCDVLTVGQYLAPSIGGHAAVARFYTPAEFDELGEAAREMGFISVASGPFVRSSYNAADVFEEARRRLAGL
ncbi:MAG: lipoyl synthase [Phycisphaerales bacterium]|nr:lipoyl synthase [Phycisphaerales bacterium]